MARFCCVPTCSAWPGVEEASWIVCCCREEMMWMSSAAGRPWCQVGRNTLTVNLEALFRRVPVQLIGKQ